MAFTVCPNCKRVGNSWKDSDVLWTNHVLKSEPIICGSCYATMKVVLNKVGPETCKHGRPKDLRCWECNVEKENNNELKELKHKVEVETLKKKLQKLCES